jgi:hypothetical protein
MVLLGCTRTIGFTVWHLPRIGRDHHGPDGDYRDDNEPDDDLEPDDDDDEDDGPDASRLII